jgi:hypothetical protein
MSAAMTTRSVYLRHTDTSGASYVAEHFVWDADRFLAARQQAAKAVNDDQKPGQPRLAKVEQITHSQYLKAKQ